MSVFFQQEGLLSTEVWHPLLEIWKNPSTLVGVRCVSGPYIPTCESRLNYGWLGDHCYVITTRDIVLSLIVRGVSWS